MEDLQKGTVVSNAQWQVRVSKDDMACALFSRCSPEMMLNILGLRMAGQISLRKTKPLEKESISIIRYWNIINKHLYSQRKSVFLAVCLPYNSRSHGGVGGPLLLHRLLQTAVDVPQSTEKVIIDTWIDFLGFLDLWFNFLLCEGKWAYGGRISAAMKIFSTSSDSMLRRCPRFIFTSSFFSSFEGFNLKTIF